MNSNGRRMVSASQTWNVKLENGVLPFGIDVGKILLVKHVVERRNLQMIIS